MSMSKRIKQNPLHLLWVAFLFLTVACGASQQSEPNSVANPQVPPAAEQPVEYGASLSEWDEATQADAQAEVVEAPANDNNVIVDEAAAAPAAAADPTASNDTTAVELPVVAEEPTPAASTEGTVFTLDDVVYQEMMWDALIPDGFTVDTIMAKYQTELAQVQDGTEEAAELYTQMQAEFNNAPVNEDLNGTFIRLPGFIAPLEFSAESITEFLLVPYFGACIHVPPPPVNQTILVKTAEGHGINAADAYYPVWIMGKLTTDGSTTELAEAGYYMADAIIEPYSDSP